MSVEGVKDSEFDLATEIKPGDSLTGLQDDEIKRFSPQMIADLHKGGGFLLAKLINLNLKNTADTPLVWEGDYNATNTIPFKAIVIPKSGAFAQKGQDAQFASALLGALTCPGTGQIISVKLDGALLTTFVASNNGGSASSFFNNDVKPALEGLGYIVDGDDYPTVVINPSTAGAAANGGVLTLSMAPKTSATTTLFFNGDYRGSGAGSFYVGQVPNGNNIFQSGPISDSSFNSFLDEIILQFTNLTYGVVDNRPAEDSLGLTAPPDTGDTYNGYQAKIKDEDDHSFLTTALSDPFSGGVTSPEVFLATASAFSGGADATPVTEVALKYCGETIWIAGYTLEAIIEGLTTDEDWASGIILNADTGKPIYKRLGDFVASIINGTLNDYFVDIYIFGEKMPELIPVP
jgi:hypothetical protein